MYIRSYSVRVPQLWYGLPGGCKLDILTVFVDFPLFFFLVYILRLIYLRFYGVPSVWLSAGR
jgi:hypothetical protein